jgi:hypothetical protein
MLLQQITKGWEHYKEKRFIWALFWSKAEGPHVLMAFLLAETQVVPGITWRRQGAHLYFPSGLSSFSYKATSIPSWGLHAEDPI